MARTSTWLHDFKRNVYSQSGEDGIIEKILEIIPDHDGWCVEFGAWDGLFLTNTRYLIESRSYSAVLIEADSKRFLDLKRNYAEKANIYPINTFVGFGENDSLDQILRSTPIPIDFDLLSIDIDGNDYHVWKAVERYRPKVVVIEFNPTIPTHIRFIQPADPRINQGTSLLPLVELGKEKGYELVSTLSFNAFFVRKEYFPLFEIENNSPEVLRIDLDLITYMFSGYDGQIFLSGNRILPWHMLELKEKKMQCLPAVLRSFPETYSVIQKAVFALYLLLTDPARLGRFIKKKLHRNT